MRNFIQTGDVVELTAPADMNSGDCALVGSFFGVATKAISNGTVGNFMIEGVFDLPKDTSTVAQGAKLYWDNTAKKVTTTSTSNTFIGHAILAAATGVSTVRVRLHGSPA